MYIYIHRICIQIQCMHRQQGPLKCFFYYNNTNKNLLNKTSFNFHLVFLYMHQLMEFFNVMYIYIVSFDYNIEDHYQ